MENVDRTVISQYANSEILLQLIHNMDAYIDPRVNFDAFYDLVFNVDTAQGFGLDLWGRIVDVPRVLQVTVLTDDYFGFYEAGDTEGFNVGPFYAGVGAGVTSNYPLSNTAYRTLIFAKALANISDGSIPSINQILMNLFPGIGNCYVTDGNDMTMTYTFTSPLTSVQLAIISQSGAVPRPVGVSATVVQP